MSEAHNVLTDVTAFLLSQLDPLLPVNSHVKTFEEVERDPYFTNIRLSLFNLVVSHGYSAISPAIVAKLEQIANLSKDKNQDFDILLTLVVLLRMFTDTSEIYWRNLDPEYKLNYSLSDDSAFSRFYNGYSVQMASLHTIRPKPLSPQIANSFLQLLSRIKSNKRVIKMLNSMLKSLHGGSSSSLYPSQGKDNSNSDAKKSKYYTYLVDVLDQHCAYLFKYIAASNPHEFHSFIRSVIITPLLVAHTHTESEIAPYLCYFSFHYITSETLPSFLDVLQRMVVRMKKSIHQEILLYFASESIQSWIMARPHDYLRVIEGLQKNSSDPALQNIQKISTSLFEDVFSSFNIERILTEGAISSATSPTVISPQELSSHLDPFEEYAIYDEESSSGHSRTASTSSGRSGYNAPYYGPQFELNDDTEDMTRVSVLTFATLMLMLSPDIFEEINNTSLKNIPDDALGTDEDTDAFDDKSSSDSPFLSRSSSSTLKSSRSSKFGLKKIRNQLTSLNHVTNKKTKFLLTILKNINGNNIISEYSILDTLRVLILISKLSTSPLLREADSSVSYFTRRLFFLMCDLLQLGSEKDAKRNPMVAHCLAKFPQSHFKLQVDYFYVACSLDADAFLEKLSDFIKRKHSGISHIRMITDGFCIYFNNATMHNTKDRIMTRIDDFLKDTACEMANILLSESNLFDEHASEVVDSIFELKPGDYSKGYQKIQFNASPLPSSSPAFMNFFSRTGDSTPTSKSTSTTSSSSLSPVEGVSAAIAGKNLRDIVAPTARRPSKSSFASLRETSSPNEGEKSTNTIRTIIDKNIKSPLRVGSMLRKTSQESISSATVKNIRDTLERHEQETTQSARIILINIFSIYKGMTRYYYMTYDEDSDTTVYLRDFNRTIKPVFASLVDDNESLFDTARGIISSVITQLKEPQVDITAFRSVCYVGSAYLLSLMGTTLFDLNLSDLKREQLLKPLVDLWTARIGIAKTYEMNDSLSDLLEEEALTFHLIRGSVGRALFCSLYSNNTAIHKLLKTAFKLFTEEIRIHQLLHEDDVDDIDDDHELDFANVEFFQVMCRDNYVSTGVVAFQRRLRTDILKYIKFPDKIVFDVSHLIYKRWYDASLKPSLSTSETSHFRNYAGFLAASCGIFSTINDSTQHHFPLLHEMKKSVEAKVSYFVGKQCSWLNNEDLLTRENSKDILATELHPLAFDALFAALRQRIDELKDINIVEKDNELSFILLEQVIMVVRMILERDDTSEVLIIVSLPLLNLIDDILRIVDTIDKSSPKYFKCVIHLSKMLKSFQHSESSICIAGYMVVKNRWLRLVTQWFQSAIFKEFDLLNLSKSHRDMDLEKRDMDYLYIDTTIESSKAIAYLTKDLVLEAPQSMSEIELQRSKSVVFGNYFNILLKALEKSTNVENFPSTLRHKIASLNENIIISLTNLLIANVDVGLNHATPIGYSNNRNIRLAFMNVFVNIVSSFDISNNRTKRKRDEIVEEVVLMTLKRPTLLSKACRICPASDIDALASSIVYFFDVKNAAHIIVTELVREEIGNATRHMEILRRNSCATRALSMLARLKGMDYLSNILKPILEELINSKECFDVEKLDPNDVDAPRNLMLFKKYMTKVVDAITGSVDSFPPQFFVICQAIHSSASERFPEYADIAVGSFLFLRFFCPALVSPDSEEIVDSLTPKARKSSMSLAKVIQNIANGSVNSIKWKILESESEFLKNCSNKIFEFLSVVSDKNRKVKINLRMQNRVLPNEFSFLHKFLYYHGLEMRNALIEDIKSFDDLATVRETAEAVDELLSLMGQPRMEFKNEIPAYIREHSETSSELYEFMIKQAVKCPETPENECKFVQESVTSEGLPVVIFNWCEYQKDGNDDVETPIYLIFQIYSKVMTKKHFFVTDCTGFDGVRQPKNRFVKLSSLFFNLIPAEGLANCETFYFFNPTPIYLEWWTEFQNSHANIFQNMNVSMSFLNTDSDPKLIKALGLSDYSKEVYHDVRVTLHDVSLYDEAKRQFSPVTLKVGNKYFQIVHDSAWTLKASDASDTIVINPNDVYEIAEVASTSVSRITGVSSEFCFELRNRKRLIMSSPKYLEILKMFYYSQAKILEEFNDNEYSDISSRHSKEAIKTADIVSHLLLVALVGLGGDDEIRVVSYNLLSSMHTTFSLNMGHLLPKTPDIYISEDPNPIFEPLIKTLAETSPELTSYYLKYSIDLLENGEHDLHFIANLLRTMRYWAKNLSKHVFLADDQKGPEIATKLVRRLVKLTVQQNQPTSLYLDYIWPVLVHDSCLLKEVIEEVVGHCMDRAAEGVDWHPACKILLRAPTIDITGVIIKRVIDITHSFLPNLKEETNVNSWTELIILVHLCSSLFCDSPLLVDIYMPEVLYIVSLLIDVGSTEMRLSLHKLLMNACQSLLSNASLPKYNRRNLYEIQKIFSDQKMKIMFGFSQERGRVLQNFSASSFLTKFTTLEHFVNNLMSLMDNGSLINVEQWKTRYMQYIMGTVFHVQSFLSARAMMILGIVSKEGISDGLLLNLLRQSMVIVAMPDVNDEQIFFVISTFFTYTKAVIGVDPQSPLLPKLFWLASSISFSINMMIYQSGLLFMSSTAQHLSLGSMEKMDRGEIPEPLIKQLMAQRNFGENILRQVEAMGDLRVTESNFSHVMISLICKGLLIPYTRATSLSSLVVFFKLFYFELMFGPNEDYLIFMFFIFILQRPSAFLKCMEDVDMDTDVVQLDDRNKIHKSLLDWLVKFSPDACLTMYKASLYFSCKATDEQGKVRFMLVYRHLMQHNLKAAFKLYPFVLNELRRLSKYSNNSSTVLLSFEIIKMAVKSKEYLKLPMIEKEMYKKLEERGLTGIKSIPFENELANDVLTGVRENPIITYERKKLAVMLLSKVISSASER